MTNRIQCAVCEAKTDAPLCKRCAADIERALAEMPAQYDDLQAVATRQAAGPLGLGDSHRQWTGPFADGALGDAPWVFAPGAADQLWALENTLTIWAADYGLNLTRPGEHYTVRTWVTFHRNRPVLHRAMTVRTEGWATVVSTAVFAARYLQTHIDEIRHSEHAEQIHDEITALHMENARWTIGHHGEQIFAGTCNAPDIRVAHLYPAGPECRPFACTHESCERIRHPEPIVSPRVGRCGADLYAAKGAAEVKCHTCGRVYPMIGQRGEIEDKLDDQWARPQLIADSLTTLDEPVNAATLRKWIERDTKLAARLARSGLPAPYPLILQVGIDDDGKALYRVGAVRARVAWSRDQAQRERVVA